MTLFILPLSNLLISIITTYYPFQFKLEYTLSFHYTFLHISFPTFFINSLTITYIYTRLEESHMEERFIVFFIQCYFIAFGVIITGCLFLSIDLFLTGKDNLSSMCCIEQSLNIWAISATLGGTFVSIEFFKILLLVESTLDMFNKILLIVSAM